MWGRLLTKAALLLAAMIGLVAIANEPRKETEQKPTQSVDGQTALPAQLVKSESTPDKGVGRNPRVLLITSKESQKCQREMERLRKPGGEFAVMQSQGWKIGTDAESHIQIVDWYEVRDVLRQLHTSDASEFPVVACVENGEVIRSFKDGCSTPLDAWTFGWMLKGVNERPGQLIPEEIRVATTSNYRLRGNHWSVDGVNNPTREYLVSHLRSETHVRFLSPSYKLEEWSVEELRSLHDDLHEKYGPAAPVPAAATSSTGRPAGLGQFSGANKALGK